MIEYDLINTTPHTISKKAIEAGIDNAVNKLNLLEQSFVSIEIVSPEESAEINQKLRGQNVSTDVISISTNESTVGEQQVKETNDGELEFRIKPAKSHRHLLPALGQLIICYDEIIDQAKTAGQSVERELEWIVEHGILHLVGYHHQTDNKNDIKEGEG